MVSDWQNILGPVAALYQARRLAEAKAALAPHLRTANVPAEAWNLAALIALGQSLDAEALSAAKRAAALAPRDAGVLNTLGLAAEAIADMAAAERAYRRAAALQPGVAALHYNVGKCLTAQGKWQAALTALDAALACDAGFVPAHNNAAVCLKNLGRLDEAAARLRQALAVRPDYPQAAYNLATLELLRGNYAEGWPLYEYRWAVRDDGRRPPPRPGMAWDGRTLTGQTLLLWAEQGFGDTLQFIRLARLAAAQGARVIVECDEALVDVVATVDGIARVYGPNQVTEPYEWHASIASLPLLLNWRPDTPVNAAPYLRATAEPRLPDGEGDGSKVGVVWAGNRKPDPARTCPLAAFRDLFQVPGIRFYSLQMGEPARELARLPANRRPHDLSPLIGNFAHTAALMRQLDLVISIDSGPAHLAGGLGVPVWLLLPRHADWRWLNQGEASPWYPTMRLFRQNRQGEWKDVVAQVTRELAALGQRAPALSRPAAD